MLLGRRQERGGSPRRWGRWVVLGQRREKRSGACVLTGALSPQGAEHAVPPGQGRRHGRPAALAVPLVSVLAGPVETGGGAARGLSDLGPAAVAGAPRAAGCAAAARAAAAGRAEDEDGAEEALQGLLHRAAARAALRVLQEQPPAQAAQGVAPAGARSAHSWRRARRPGPEPPAGTIADTSPAIVCVTVCHL